MSHEGSVTRLIHDLRLEDPAKRDVAARLIWQRYFHSLLELARSHLDRRVRPRTDEEDIAQSMYKSFCLRQQRGEFDLAGRDELWRLLVTITLRKVRQRRQHAERRGSATLPGSNQSPPKRAKFASMDARRNGRCRADPGGSDGAERGPREAARRARRFRIAADFTLASGRIYQSRDRQRSIAPSARSNVKSVESAPCGGLSTTAALERRQNVRKCATWSADRPWWR